MIKKLLIVLSIIFIASSAHSQVRWVKYAYFKNQGGLNDQQSTTEIEDGEATDIQNIVFDVPGALKKRFGYTTVDSFKISTGTTVNVNGIEFFKLDNGTRYLVAVANRDGSVTVKSKSYTSGGGPNAYWATIDGALNATGYAKDNLCSFVVAQNSLVFTYGLQDKPYRWTGSGHVTKLTADADCPNATILSFHKNHLFLSGNSSTPSRVWFSELGDITTYTATDFFDVDTSDGSSVRALLSAYDSLYIFKDESIWRLSGYERDSFRLEKMVDGVGTVAQNSVVATNTGIYFVSNQNDIFHYDGAYTVTHVSSKITQTINNTNKSRSQFSIGLAYSTYRFQDTDYYVAIASNADMTNNKVMIFDTSYKAWTKFLGLEPQSWCVGENSSGGKSIFFGDYSGYVHEYPSTSYYDGNVSTSPILSFYQTKWFRYPEICLGDKYWRLLKVYCLSADDTIIHAECKADYEASGKVVDIDLSPSLAEWDVAIWDTDVWGGDTIIIGRNEIDKGTNMFQIKFYNNELNQGFTILGYENFIEPSERI